MATNSGSFSTSSSLGGSYPPAVTPSLMHLQPLADFLFAWIFLVLDTHANGNNELMVYLCCIMCRYFIAFVWRNNISLCSFTTFYFLFTSWWHLSCSCFFFLKLLWIIVLWTFVDKFSYECSLGYICRREIAGPSGNSMFNHLRTEMPFFTFPPVVNEGSSPDSISPHF